MIETTLQNRRSTALRRAASTLCSALLVTLVTACSSGVSEVDLQGAESAKQSFSLPGENYSRFEYSGDNISFYSDSSPGFVANLDDSSRVSLEWASLDDSVQYQIYRSESSNMLNDGLCQDDTTIDSDGFYEIAALAENSYTDTDLNTNLRYEYRISSLNSDQVSKTIASGLMVSISEAENIISAANTDTSAQTEESLAQSFASALPTANTDNAEIVSSALISNENSSTDNPLSVVSTTLAPVELPSENQKPDSIVVPVFTTETAPVVTPETEKPLDIMAEETPTNESLAIDSQTANITIGCIPTITNETSGGEYSPNVVGTSSPSDSVDNQAVLTVADANKQQAQPNILAPEANSDIYESDVLISWDQNDSNAQEWWVRAGSSGGANNYYDSGRISDPTSSSHLISGLPVSGALIHIQLSYKGTDGQWDAIRQQHFSQIPAGQTEVEAEVEVFAETNAQSETLLSNHDWDNKISPPTLVDPLEIVMSDQYPTIHFADYDEVGCEGLIHKIEVPYDRDVLVTMEDGSAPLEYAVWITGGRNLHLKGLEMRTVVQAGCDVGEAHQVRDPSNLNIHPRLPGGKVFRLEQSGTTFVEGLDIDLKGQEADCFVVRNPSSMTLEEALSQRHIYFVNTRCTGIEGLDDSPIGDGLHGDFFQNQGKDSIGTFTIENVSFRTSSNGITLHAWNGQAGIPLLFSLRNMDYGWDLRYDDDDAYEISGLAYSAHGHNYEFENVYLNHPNNGNYGFLNGERKGAVARGNGYITKLEGVYEGTPPNGDFATEETTGIEYVSPF